MVDEVDHFVLKKRCEEMIGLLEYDAMRSAGKMKLNSQHLHSLYYLLEKYKQKGAMPKKTTPKKLVEENSN